MSELLALLLLLVLGCGAGIITGLLPGLHPNAVIFLSLPLYLAWQPPVMQFIAFVTGMSVVHTFVSYIPSILIAGPDGENALSVTPGRRMVEDGNGLIAIRLTVYGGLFSAIIVLAGLPLIGILVPIIYEPLRANMHLVLGGLLGVLIMQDENKLRTAWIMALSGLLGVIVLHAPVVNTQYALFPLFGGLFGLSTICYLLAEQRPIPEQQTDSAIPVHATVKGSVLGCGAGMLAGFLPGIGSSQSALLVGTATDMKEHDFITALGGINTTDLFLSLIALYVIGNPRSGAAVAIQQIAPAVTLEIIALVAGMAMIAVGFGALLTFYLASFAVQVIHMIDHRILIGMVAGFIVVGSLLLSGLIGLVILISATGLGIHAQSLNVRKSYAMAVLIVPTILFYVGITVTL